MCGEQWERATVHVCDAVRTVVHADSLASLLQEIIQDLDVGINAAPIEVNIASVLATVLSQGIADQLVLRRINLMGALVRDDVLVPNTSFDDIEQAWRLAGA